MCILICTSPISLQLAEILEVWPVQAASDPIQVAYAVAIKVGIHQRLPHMVLGTTTIGKSL